MREAEPLGHDKQHRTQQAQRHAVSKNRHHGLARRHLPPGQRPQHESPYGTAANAQRIEGLKQAGKGIHIQSRPRQQRPRRADCQAQTHRQQQPLQRQVRPVGAA